MVFVNRYICLAKYPLLIILSLLLSVPANAEEDASRLESLQDSRIDTEKMSDEPDNLIDEEEEGVQGVYQIKFGGWSEHYISGNASNYDFNESHEGLGLAYSHFDEDSKRFFNGYNYEFWYMKDSFYKDNLQASYGLFHRKVLDVWGIKSIDVGINFAAISRSTADIDTNTAELKNHERLHTLMLIPSLSVYTKHKFHLDFVFLPAIPNVSDYSVLFFRAGFNL